MSILAAAASHDGVSVDQHFGKAEVFRIYRWDTDRFVFDSRREVIPLCGKDGHEENIQNALDRFSDCRFVLAVTAGPPVIQGFAARGVDFLSVEETIEAALARLAAYPAYKREFQHRSDANVQKN